MLAKLTSKNQLTLPKAAIEAAGSAIYFEIEIRAGQLVLTPVRIQRADAVRAKLAALGLDDDDLATAVAWARRPAATAPAKRVSEPRGAYATPKAGKKTARKKTARKRPAE